MDESTAEITAAATLPRIPVWSLKLPLLPVVLSLAGVLVDGVTATEEGNLSYSIGI